MYTWAQLVAELKDIEFGNLLDSYMFGLSV